MTIRGRNEHKIQATAQRNKKILCIFERKTDNANGIG